MSFVAAVGGRGWEDGTGVEDTGGKGQCEVAVHGHGMRLDMAMRGKSEERRRLRAQNGHTKRAQNAHLPGRCLGPLTIFRLMPYSDTMLLLRDRLTVADAFMMLAEERELRHDTEVLGW